MIAIWTMKKLNNCTKNWYRSPSICGQYFSTVKTFALWTSNFPHFSQFKMNIAKKNTGKQSNETNSTFDERCKLKCWKEKTQASLHFEMFVWTLFATMQWVTSIYASSSGSCTNYMNTTWTVLCIFFARLFAWKHKRNIW